ncbi:zinc finger protein [Macleaya cordata]|uniref:GATA transcription factor n=1 Tax=Macleaya cordata TaxID=56857 RepID=A0A200R5T7_MACCD|nr:zinc finger protein [Macleaya cordata]
MFGPAFTDDTNNCGDFFDNIDDLLNFPLEDVESGDFNNLRSVWSPPPPPQTDVLASSTAVFSDTNNTTSSELPPTGLSVPYEDFPQLEWLSSFMEDSFSAGSIIPDKVTFASVTDNKNNNSSNNNTNNDFHHPFQTSSPVSVLESSSSCSGGKTMLLNAETFIRGRARSKRPRPAAFNPRSVIQLISPTSSVTDATTTSSELLSEIGNHAESRLVTKISEPNTSFESKQKKIKIKKRKLPPLPGSVYHQTGAPSTTPARKCLHCEITKTPQWRAGPMGPKTLCNACGVRYKSGRLYPEYRPAASPTFVAALHSNSHKKVLEMRIRSCEKLQQPEFMPKGSHLVEQI